MARPMYLNPTELKSELLVTQLSHQNFKTQRSLHMKSAFVCYNENNRVYRKEKISFYDEKDYSVL